MPSLGTRLQAAGYIRRTAGNNKGDPMTKPLRDTFISLARDQAGRSMRELIEAILAKELGKTALHTQTDAVSLVMEHRECIITTDSFTVQPLEFAGGDIGALAALGTLNDLAVAGALPRYLSLNAILEEGLEIAQFERIIASLARVARQHGVRVVAGDTHVVPRGEGGGLYLICTGMGTRLPGSRLNPQEIRPGDAILISGPIGDHATAVLQARGACGTPGEVQSDLACVLPLTRALQDFSGLRFMRDPSHGGVATVCQQIQRATGFGISLDANSIPLRPGVRATCTRLGQDPLYLACAGRILAVIAANQADAALQSLRRLPNAEQAAIIGHIDRQSTQLVLHEATGPRRLETCVDQPLMRMC